jgi:hypothetical protein
VSCFEIMLDKHLLILQSIESDTEVIVWKAETGKKPRSMPQVLKILY